MCRFYPIFLLLILPHLGLSQVSRFYKSFEVGDVEYGFSIASLPNRDLILAGPLGWGPNGADAYLMRLDQTGNVIWNFAYGEFRSEQGYDVSVLPDGFLLVGTHSAVSNANGEGLIVRTDLNGQVIWARGLSGPMDESLYSCAVLPSGDFVVCGQTNSFGAGNVDAWLARISASGNLMWTRTFGGAGIEAGFGIELTREGDLLMAGYTNSFGAGGYNGFLAKFDTLGAFKWGKSYGGPGGELSYRPLVSRQGGYLLTGYSSAFGVGGQDGYAIRTDTAGNVIWARAYGTAAMDRVFDSADGPVSGFYLSGETTTSTFGAGDHMILRIDANGNLIWANHYGTPVDETGYGTSCLTPDGGLALACWDDNAEDAVVLKIDSTGELGCARGAISPIVTNLAIVPVSGGSVGTGGSIFTLNLTAMPFAFTENVYCSVVLDGESPVLEGKPTREGNQLWFENEVGYHARLNRSVDGIFFFDAELEPNCWGNHCTWLDKHPELETWYKMAWMDMEGRYHTSNTVHLRTSPSQPPFRPFNIGMNLWDIGESEQVSVWDAAGRQIHAYPSGTKTVDLNGLPSGVYWLQGLEKGERWVMKCVR